MSDDNASTHLPEPHASQPEAAAAASQPAQLAKIRILHSGVQVRGFTFGAGQTVSGVSLAMAEHLESTGQVQILDISNAS